MTTYPKYLKQITTTVAKQLFNVPEGTIHYWIKQGCLSASTVVHGKVMEVQEFSRLEFQRYLFTEGAGAHQRDFEDVSINDLTFDKEFMVRVKELNLNKVRDYAERLKLGSEPPPIAVAMIDGDRYILGGRHRVAAAKLVGRQRVKAMVIAVCNRAEAFYVARTDNDDHGLPQSTSDRKALILAGLLRPEYAQMTVPQLAVEFQYSERQVQRIRKELCDGKPSAKRIPDEQTLEQRAFDQLTRSIEVLERFRPELTEQLKAVIAESEAGVTLSPPV